MKLIYVCLGDVSVFEAQVLELLRQMQKRNVYVSLLLGYKDQKEKESYLRKLKGYSDVHVFWTKSFPMYSYYEKKASNALYKGLLQIPNLEHSVIHIRSEYAGYLLKKIAIEKNLTNRIVIDARAIVLEELKYKSNLLPFKRRICNLLQLRYVRRFYAELFKDDRRCDIAISSVSPKINEYIRQYYPKCSYSLYFNPNIAGGQFVFDENARKKKREELGVSDDEVLAICSSNGAALWQKDFKVVNCLCEKGIRVLNLSKNDYGLDSCITKTVPFSQMPEYLSAADVAVLWRDDVMMNQVASPSKFSEFAAMGLYVVHNASVYVATDYIKRTGNGLLVNRIEDIKNNKFNSDEIFSKRKSRVQEGRQCFGVDGIIQSYIDIYLNKKE